jgi:hypothetical protein
MYISYRDSNEICKEWENVNTGNVKDLITVAFRIFIFESDDSNNGRNKRGRL